MTFTAKADAKTPLLEFFITAKWTQLPDPGKTAKGVAISSIFVTKMTRMWVDPDEETGAFADRVYALLVGHHLGRVKHGMHLVFNHRVCDESKPIKTYYSRWTPYLDLEVRSV